AHPQPGQEQRGDDGDGEQEALGTGGLIGGHIHVLEPGPSPGPAPPLRGETPPPPLARYASSGAIRAGAAHAPLCARIPPGRRPVEWWLICQPAMRGRLL